MYRLFQDSLPARPFNTFGDVVDFLEEMIGERLLALDRFRLKRGQHVRIGNGTFCLKVEETVAIAA